VDCGIYIDTGRPLLTSQAIDEDALYVRTENWVRFLSFWIWVTPMPMPIASEAYGGLKPYVIWTVAILTAIASIAFYVAMDGTEDAPARVLMLWPPHAHPVAPRLTKEQLRQLIRDMTPQQQDVLEKKLTELHGRVDRDTLWQILKAAKPDLPDPPVEPFQWWQLWTHTLLHDPGSLFGLLGHLGGNMLFLLVFGTRVNALIGQTKMVFLYPLLAVAAAEAHLWAMGSNPPALPLLGASGVIMGLAGMYLVLFPAHRVYCAMWIRILIGLRLWGVKIFAIRGFWVLLIYFAYDLTMAWLLGAGGAGVAHFAHIGGFLTGVLIAVLLLLTRQVDARGGDLLTLLLGKRAWSLIGRPAHRRKPLPAPHPTPAASGTP
jgi:membrane associated rhomboid family serine protease